jgi:uncharacterized protein
MSFVHQPFQIFTKPVSDRCNLRCSYCYYHTEIPGDKKARTMLTDENLLETSIRQQMEATTSETVFFSWHGGEPTLAGIDFYRKAVQIQKIYLPAGKRLLNGIQTNGTLIDDEWCRFLKSEHFIAGVSIDGPEMLHNHFRKNKSKNGSFNEAYRGFTLLQKYGIPVEILCVVSSANENFASEVYSFFRKSGARFITFLPLVEHEFKSETGVTARSVHPEKFGQFLITVFDEWIANDIGKIHVQIFEDTIDTVFSGDHSICIFKKNCGRVPVIESNGDFYACDHFVNKNHFHGNILENPIRFYLNSEKQQKFGLAKSKTLTDYCKTCEVLDFCNGECPKNRFIKSPEGEEGLNYLCAGYKLFFNHCRPFIEEVRKAAGQNTERV